MPRPSQTDETTVFSALARLAPCSLSVHTYSCDDLRRWHWHNLAAPYWRLYCVESPGCVILHAGRELPLLPGQLTLVAPRTPFAARLPRPPVRQHYMHFNAGLPYDLHSPAVYQWAASADLGLVLADLRERAPHGGLSLQFPALALVSGALALVPEDNWPEPIADSRVKRALALIEQRPCADLGNPVLARRVGMSLSAFKKRFREQVGVTPQEMRRQFRMERAASLLARTDESIEEIAEECGFGDRYTFTKAFSRFYAAAPATYRRRFRRGR